MKIFLAIMLLICVSNNAHAVPISLAPFSCERAGATEANDLVTITAGIAVMASLCTLYKNVMGKKFTCGRTNTYVNIDDEDEIYTPCLNPQGEIRILGPNFEPVTPHRIFPFSFGFQRERTPRTSPIRLKDGLKQALGITVGASALGMITCGGILTTAALYKKMSNHA